MKNYIITALLALLIGAGAGYYGARYKQCGAGECKGGKVSEQGCALQRGMEKLWAEHVLWTRQFIVSSVAGLGDAGDAAKRLLKNQEDIGNAIVPFYGQEAGTQLTKLLKEHITIAADIVAAAIKKEDAKVKDLDTKWHKNAADIAAFLSKANPNWTEAGLTDMLNHHLALTTQELLLRLKGDWAEDISNYDQVFDQGLMMGKDLADGIIKQFPDKF